jgi:signal transduction histidine kinase
MTFGKPQDAQNTRFNWDLGNFAFVATVLAAMLTAWLARDPMSVGRAVGFWLTGLSFAGLGGFVFDPLEETNNAEKGLGWPIHLYFIVQSGLGLSLIWLARGEPLIGIAIIPLTSHLVISYRDWPGLAASALLMAAGGVAHNLGGLSTLASLNLTLSYSAATLAIVMFTQAALRERDLRQEVETLNTELNGANQKLRQYASQSAELATAQERNRLAREIHDSLGHCLTTVTIQLDVAQQLIEADPAKAQDVVQKAHSLTKQGLRDVREAVAAWRSSPLTGQSLPEAIHQLAATAEQTGLDVAVTLSGPLDDLPPQLELTLYRAVQEALTNVHKHSQAETVRISLTCAEDIHLRVWNDGPPTSPAAESSGFGLLGLRERVEMLGGQLTAQAPTPTSFVCEVKIPCPPPT